MKCKIIQKITLLLFIGILFLARGSTTGYAQVEQDSGVDVVILIDNSRGLNFLDTENMRFSATKYMVDYLHGMGEASNIRPWVSVANFSSTVTNAISLRPMLDDTIREEITKETSVSTTKFEPALQFAYDQLKPDFNTGKKMVVFLVTDGIPGEGGADYSGKQLIDYFENLGDDIEQLSQRGVDIYLLSIKTNRNDVRQGWTQYITDDHFLFIDQQETLINNFRQIMENYIPSVTGESQIVSNDPSPQRVLIEPYLENVVFTFLSKDSSMPLDVSLKDPNGVEAFPINIGDDYFYKVFVLKAPLSGEWTIEWKDNSSVQFWVDKEYPLLQIKVEAQPYPYVSYPIKITAWMERNGEIVVPSRDIKMNAQITLPDSSIYPETFPLIRNGEGVFSAGFSDTKMQDMYRVKVNVTYLDSEYPVRETAGEISLLPLLPLPTYTLAPTGTPVIIEVTQSVNANPETTIDDNSPNTLPWWIIGGCFLVFFIFVIVYFMITTSKIHRFIQSNPDNWKKEEINNTKKLIKRMNIFKKGPIQKELIEKSKRKIDVIVQEKGGKEKERSYKGLYHLLDLLTYHSGILNNEEIINYLARNRGCFFSEFNHEKLQNDILKIAFCKGIVMDCCRKNSISPLYNNITVFRYSANLISILEEEEFKNEEIKSLLCLYLKGYTENAYHVENAFSIDKTKSKKIFDLVKEISQKAQEIIFSNSHIKFINNNLNDLQFNIKESSIEITNPSPGIRHESIGLKSCSKENFDPNDVKIMLDVGIMYALMNKRYEIRNYPINYQPQSEYFRKTKCFFGNDKR